MPELPEGLLQNIRGVQAPVGLEFFTPYSHGPMPGVEVQANVIHTILKGTFIRPIGWDAPAPGR